jgi:hypothetical protein
VKELTITVYRNDINIVESEKVALNTIKPTKTNHHWLFIMLILVELLTITV